jgi:hypothetical protein
VICRALQAGGVGVGKSGWFKARRGAMRSGEGSWHTCASGT